MAASLEARISAIVRKWFLTEPLLFSVAAKHSIIENPSLSIPARIGQLRLEYNPQFLEKCSEEELDACFTCEIYRALLGHPYARQPYNCKKKVLSLASDVSLSLLLDKEFIEKLPYELAGLSYLKYHASRIKNLQHPLGQKWDNSPELAFFQRNLHFDNSGFLIVQDDLSFEEWYRKILFLIEQTSIAGSESAGEGGQLSALQDADQAGELWEENQALAEEIKNQIKKAECDQGWGGIGANLALELRESADFSFDYRRALTRFRAKIVSANRHLTRMRPSRRYGFKAMGSRYERKANILIAVDVSGSITEESFSHFYRAINNFFFLGIIEKIDLIFFDVNLKNTSPIPFKGSASKIKLEQIKGRGGTSFQPAFDFFTARSSEYSGMIIFTDGEGNPPNITAGTSSVLWILDSRLAWEKSRRWIESLPGNTSTYLPF
ncbi:MAG: VWA-like domain-containing protein [Treponema sp.]|nr:VWA-like domain-containing protein [Treponema sp.]